VFRELLAIELEWRFAHDQVPSTSEYQARFPANHEAIRQAFFETLPPILSAAKDPGSTSPSARSADDEPSTSAPSQPIMKG
jgi:hypothetical protein